MIKASELRIGNAIWDDTLNKIKWVTHRVISDLASHPSPLPYSPIALNPDWLRKCGFKDEGSHDGGNSSWRHPDFPFGLTDTNGAPGFSLYYYDDNDCVYPGEVDFVHELQNIWLDLTRKEIEIKL